MDKGLLEPFDTSDQPGSEPGVQGEKAAVAFSNGHESLSAGGVVVGAAGPEVLGPADVLGSEAELSFKTRHVVEVSLGVVREVASTQGTAKLAATSSKPSGVSVASRPAAGS